MEWLGLSTRVRLIVVGIMGFSTLEVKRIWLKRFIATSFTLIPGVPVLFWTV